VRVEGETPHDVAELRPLCAFLHPRHGLGDPASDGLVGFGGGTGREERVEGEDAAWGGAYLRRKDSLVAAEE
jgi:hypothetical protein